MSVLDDLKTARKQYRDPRFNCLVCSWLDTQDPELEIEIVDWIREGLSRRGLLRILRPHGLECGASTFLKHARQCVLGEEII